MHRCAAKQRAVKVFPFQNYLARNFYNLRFLALFVCFAINFILLFYKVTSFSQSEFSLIINVSLSCWISVKQVIRMADAD